MTEKGIERRMCELVRKRGGLTYKFESVNAPGVPDRIVITPGGAVWFVELKVDNGRVSRMQKWQQDALKAHGANVRVVRGMDDMTGFVDEVMGSGI
jgi:hypothetical protein